MGFIDIFLGSSVFMGLLALIFTVFCIRCLIYGFWGGTSTILRILATIVFAVIAYYLWQRALYISGPNIIDRFVFDSWHDVVRFVKSIKL